MQLRLLSKLTSEDYVKQGGWKNANLSQCPIHGGRSCGFRSCGTYERKQPAGLLVRRWYCPKAHQTFSLLPDFAASRVSGTLDDIEGVAAAVGAALERGDTFEMAARELRQDIEAAGAKRWVRRRVRWVQATLTSLLGLAPDVFAGCEQTIAGVRAALMVGHALMRAREIVAPHLSSLPAPVGFGPLLKKPARRPTSPAHNMGPDVPPPDT